MYVYIYTFIHFHIYMYTHTYFNTHMYVCVTSLYTLHALLLLHPHSQTFKSHNFSFYLPSSVRRTSIHALTLTLTHTQAKIGTLYRPSEQVCFNFVLCTYFGARLYWRTVRWFVEACL